MSAQHVRPGRSGKRARRERALDAITSRLEHLEAVRGGVATEYFKKYHSSYFERLHKEASALRAELARPLRPIPPHQSRKLTR